METSIFQQYYTIPNKLIDRISISNERGVDVIIPLINTNELFERNLYSFYKQIPINRLLIGDGGCTDRSIEIANKFPRVEVFDHSKCISQGGSIIDLIKNVQTETFIYLHADVFLPGEWYEKMTPKLLEFEWFECPQKITTLIEFWNYKAERSFSGAQMGKKKFFDKFIQTIDDDYLQRNEDIILAELVNEHGGKYGKNEDTFHYHQVMNRRGEKEPNFKSLRIEKETDKEWEIRIFTMQYKGIIKYLDPSKKYLIQGVNNSLMRLQMYDALDIDKTKKWIKITNEKWLPYISLKRNSLKIIIKKIIGKMR